MESEKLYNLIESLVTICAKENKEETIKNLIKDLYYQENVDIALELIDIISMTGKEKLCTMDTIELVARLHDISPASLKALLSYLEYDQYFKSQ